MSSLMKRKKLTPDLVPSSSEDESSKQEVSSELSPGKEDGDGIKAERNSDNEYFFDLGKKRRITIRKWKGNCYIDIREFYEDGGELKPGKKGISLSFEQWQMIKKVQESVDKEVSSLTAVKVFQKNPCGHIFNKMSSEKVQQPQQQQQQQLTMEDLINVRGQLERDVQYMSASLGQLKEVSDRFTDNIALLQNYQEIPAGKPVMVPLTSSMFVSGTLKDPQHVMVDLGTGYYVDKDVKEAEEYYQRRIAFIHQQMEKVERALDTKKMQFQSCAMQLNALQQQSVKK